MSKPSIVAVWAPPLFLVVFGSIFLAGGAASLRNLSGDGKAEESAWSNAVAAAIGLIVGGGAVAAAPFAYRHARRSAELRESEPTRPWLWRDDWRRGEVRSGARRAALALRACALFWNGVLSLGFVGDSWPIGDGRQDVLFLIPFVLIGIGLVGLSVYHAVRWWRFGESTLHLARLPGVIGGRLEGVITAPPAIADSPDVELRLRCQEAVTSGGGNARSRKEVELYEHRQTVEPPLDRDETGGVRIPVSIDIPAGVPPTDDDRDIAWKLRVRASLPGVDYGAEFEVPVFEVEDTPEAGARATDPAASTTNDLIDGVLRREGLVVTTPDSNGIRYEAPAGRHVVRAATISAGQLAWIGVAVTTWAWADEMAGYGVAAMLTASNVMLLSSTYSAWALASEFTTTGDRWLVRTGLIGFRGEGRLIDASQVDRIELAPGARIPSMPPALPGCDIVARLRGGESIRLLRGIKSTEARVALINQLRKAAGLS